MWIARSSAHELRKTFWLAEDGQLQQDKLSPGDRFAYEEHSVRSLRDVYTFLSRLVDDEHAALVMGRAKIAEGERNAAYFEDKPTEFWVIDLDGVPLAGSVTDTIERCLPFLAGKAYVYAFTQSAGLKDGLRCRVVCRVPRKLSNPEFATFARHYNDRLVAFEGKKKKYLDPSIYSPGHFVFTARPKLVGMSDPHPERVFYVGGGEEPVVLDALPEMVEIVDPGNRVTFTELPRLIGDWGYEDRDGYGRGRNAFVSLCYLRAYMGEKDWADEDKRRKLWCEMFDNARASKFERDKYGGDFCISRAKYVTHLPTGERKYQVLANPDRSVSLEVATQRLDDIMRRAVQLQEPKVICVMVTVGVGKTRQALHHLGVQHRFVDQTTVGTFNIDYYVPTMRMGEEVLATAREHGLDGFIEYGRSQKVGSEPVCIKSQSAGKLQGLVDSVAESLCHNHKTGDMCEHYHACRWQWQRNQTQHFPLRIRAHNYLPLTVRAEHHEAYRKIDFVVIDEASFVDDLLHTQWVDIGDLVAPRLEGEDYDWVLKFAKILEQGLTLDRLREAGFTQDVCRQLIKAEEALKPRLDVSPVWSPERTWSAVKDYEVNWYQFASVWRRLRDCIECGSLNRIKVAKEYLILAWKSPIEGIPWDNEARRPKVPVLIMSGTMRRSIIEQFFPIDEWHEIDVAPHPGAEIVQSDLRGSKAECLYGATKERFDRGENKGDKILAAKKVREIVREASKDRVLITYKELEEQLKHTPVAHFNAIEGLNEYSGQDLTVYGRPVPDPRDMEDKARSIFCDDAPIREIKSYWYPKRSIAYRGVGRFGVSEYHPDPRVEDIRWMTCEAEVLQAIGRSRYVRRPVKVLILNQIPLPLRLSRAVPYERLDPQWAEFERTRVVPLSHREWARIWPRIWSDGRSAERWVKENGERWAEENVAFVVTYRREGARGKMSRAIVAGTSAIALLGTVTEWDFDDNKADHNDWALCMREARDLLAREPVDGEGMPFEWGPARIGGEDVR